MYSIDTTLALSSFESRIEPKRVLQSEDDKKPGWWEIMIGPGKAFGFGLLSIAPAMPLIRS